MDTKTQTEGVLPKIRHPRRLRRKLASGKEIVIGKSPWWYWIFTSIMLIIATIGTFFILLFSPLPIIYASSLSLAFLVVLQNATSFHPWVFRYYMFLFFLIGLLHFALHYGWIQE